MFFKSKFELSGDRAEASSSGILFHLSTTSMVKKFLLWEVLT